MKKFKDFLLKLNEENDNLFNKDDALYIINALGLQHENIDPEQLAIGMNIELEHADIMPPDNAKLMAAKIALSHIREYPKYYIELQKMEKKLEKKK